MVKIDFWKKKHVFMFNSTKAVENFLKNLDNNNKLKYRLISENANDLIVVLDENLNLIYLNEPVFLKNLNLSYIDVKTLNYKILHKNDIELIKSSLNQLFKKGEISFEARVHNNNDKYLNFEVNGKCFTNNKTMRAVLIARDITKRKEFEQQIKQAYDKETFYKKVFTHDMNNILNNIQSAVILLDSNLKENKEESKSRDFLTILKEQVERGKDLISNVRLFSNIDETEIPLYILDPIKILKDATNILLISFSHKKINISYDIDKNLYKVKANELLFEVFENILINAVRHNINEKIELKIRISEINSNQTQWMKIEFIDNGIGVPDSLKQKIFKEECDFKALTHGMGIGLSLVKKILKIFQGKIWVENRVEGDYSKGSNFIVFIPIAS